MGTCDALLDIVCAGQLELDRDGELALVQIDFSAGFDRVNHGGLVFKLREAGVGGLILKVFENFLSSRTQRVKVDGVFSSSIDVVSGVPQGSVADLPRLLQNELVGYADDFTLLCRIPHPRDRSSVAASLNADLAVIGLAYCCLCLDEGWHIEEDNECFSRCHCSCQVLLGIYTPCARVLFSSLDVCSHFSPVVA